MCANATTTPRLSSSKMIITIMREKSDNREIEQIQTNLCQLITAYEVLNECVAHMSKRLTRPRTVALTNRQSLHTNTHNQPASQTANQPATNQNAQTRSRRRALTSDDATSTVVLIPPHSVRLRSFVSVV